MKNKVSSFLFRATALALFAAPLTTVQAQEVYSATIGATAITVPGNSDVMVALPFTQEKSAGGVVASVAGAVVTLQGSALAANEFDESDSGVANYYLYVETGDSIKGRHFDIVSNTASTITLGSADLTGLNGQTVSVREHWTLGTLFPNGVGGVVEDEPGRPTIEVILPISASVGGGIAVSKVFCFYDDGTTAAWRESGKPISFNSNDTVVSSGAAMVVRNNGAAAVDYYFFGEVEFGPMAIPLVSSGSDTIDNFVAVGRPLGLTIDELQLHSSGAFASEDRLLVYPLDSGKIGPAKSPDVYLYADGKWQKEGDSSGANVGSTLLKAGQGLAVRKATGVAATAFWVNEWSISQQ